MEALILILVIAIVVGFIIFKSTSEEALEVLDKAKNEKPAQAPKATTKIIKKPQPVKVTETKTKAAPTATKAKPATTKTTAKPATTKPTGRKKKV